MQVQSVQTTNNCRKPCFRAKFINDCHGYISGACKSAEMTNVLKRNISTFSKRFPKTELEILNVEKNNNLSSYVYNIYNHSTGKTAYFFIPNNVKQKSTLNKLLSLINTRIKSYDDFFYVSILGNFVEDL